MAISHRGLVRGNYLSQVQKIIDGGVDYFLLREKDLPLEDYKFLAEQIISLCHNQTTRCILHFHTKAALQLEYDMLHLPFEKFMCLKKSEKAKFRILGVSTHTVEEARLAMKAGASYITASHIYKTSCKEGLEPRGITYLKEVCSAVTIPVYALGGIHVEQVRECMEQNAQGICMMSDFMRCENPLELVQKIRNL